MFPYYSMALATEIEAKRISFTKDFDMEFQNQLHAYVDSTRGKNDPPSVCGKGASNKERCQYLQAAVMWLKVELREMRCQDRSLAKQLIGLRTKIQNIMQRSEDDFYASDMMMETINSDNEDTKL